MSDDAIANRLFGETKAGSPPPETTVSMMGWVEKLNQPSPEPSCRDNDSFVIDEKIAGEALYGGDVLDSYEHIISPVLEQEAFKARFDGNHEEALTINKASRELGTVFKEYAVSDNLAKDIMTEAGDYLREQRSDEAILNTEEATMKALQEKYGDDLNKNLAGARRVAQEINKRVPNFFHVLDRTGLGNSLKVAEGLIQSARNKGYVK